MDAILSVPREMGRNVTERDVTLLCWSEMARERDARIQLNEQGGT